MLTQKLWLCFETFLQIYLGHEARVHASTCSSQLSGDGIYGQLSQLWHIYLDTISPEQQAWPIEGNWLSCDPHVDYQKYVACRWDGGIWSGANADERNKVVAKIRGFHVNVEVRIRFTDSQKG